MKQFGELWQSADWKTEKHVPVIECPEAVKAGESFEVKAAVGKEVAHPNTTEHHIRWIALYFLPEGAKFAAEVGRFEFGAHGESVEGPNKGPVYTDHALTVSMKVSAAGTVYAVSLCNIHGLWQSSREIKVS